ncbi:hypothetical protein L1987_07108 [Smallanthus sonchifolius]|uniref:Uncharacterized protein n=1 Tax=Smallanthus sonchifolius TaxID=185202 RepID=A0ACB9K049_9ASTR|nr:hypothetical protein L1987_07108 [Smallanthus sonchifolius]
MKNITLRHPSGNKSTGRKAKRTTTNVLQSFTTLCLLCAKQALIASRKLKDNSKISQDSSMIQRPKKLIATISNKAIKLRHRKNITVGEGNIRDDGSPEFGDDGLWQREILMGDKCQPLDFSGVINYDKDGKRKDQFPVRSPRANESLFPGHVTKFDWVPPRE